MNDERCYEAICRITPTGDTDKIEHLEALLDEAEGFQGGFESDKVEDEAPGAVGCHHYYFKLAQRAAVELEPRLVGFLVQCGLAGSVQVAEAEEVDWTKKFREFFRPAQISPNFWVCPKTCLEETKAKPEEMGRFAGQAIIIEPGMGFGTGYHETTQMCLEFMEEWLKGGESFLDLGSGSGILCIAASKLRSGRVVAVECDPQANINARENFEINGVADAIQLFEGTLDQLPHEQFNAIACNMLLNEFVPLFAPMRRRLAQEGRLILSGYLLKEENVALDTAASAGFEPLLKKEKGEWGASLLRLRK
ncbi:MAG: 50S ribosomal protein L11 methyltransferase [bacterium]